MSRFRPNLARSLNSAGSQIPGVLGGRSGTSLAQSVAVVVVSERDGGSRGQLVRRVVAIRRHVQGRKPIPHAVIRIVLRGRSPLGHSREFVNRIVDVLLSHIIELVDLGRAGACIVVGVTGPIRCGPAALAQDTQKPRQRIVTGAGVLAIT
jgi:hypothetical protein